MSLAGGCAPPRPSRTSALRGSGPPTHPRISFHVGAAPPRPRPDRQAERTPFRHSGESRNPSGASEAVRRPPANKPSRPSARLLRGALRGIPASGDTAPHTPIPDERAARLVAHPPALGFSSMWGLRPHAPNRSAGGCAGGGSRPQRLRRLTSQSASTKPRGRTRTPFRHSGESFRHSGESRNPSGASEGVRRPPADKPPRAHRAPLARIKAGSLRGNPAAHPAQPPAWQRSPKNPQVDRRGGVWGGAPP